MTDRENHGSPLGFHRIPEHYVAPVLRWNTYHRIVGSGTAWINPLSESLLPAIFVGTRTLSYRLEGAQTSDPIEFSAEIVFRFRFDPRRSARSDVSELVRHTPQQLEFRVRDRLDSIARSVFLRYRVADLHTAQKRLEIQHQLSRVLAVRTAPVGHSACQTATVCCSNGSNCRPGGMKP